MTVSYRITRTQTYIS